MAAKKPNTSTPAKNTGGAGKKAAAARRASPSFSNPNPGPAPTKSFGEYGVKESKPVGDRRPPAKTNTSVPAKGTGGAQKKAVAVKKAAIAEGNRRAESMGMGADPRPRRGSSGPRGY